MKPGEKNFISHVLAFFAASDGIVNENLVRTGRGMSFSVNKYLVVGVILRRRQDAMFALAKIMCRFTTRPLNAVVILNISVYSGLDIIQRH